MEKSIWLSIYRGFIAIMVGIMALAGAIYTANVGQEKQAQGIRDNKIETILTKQNEANTDLAVIKLRVTNIELGMTRQDLRMDKFDISLEEINHDIKDRSLRNKIRTFTLN